MFKSEGLFSRFMNLLFDILYVGILWILCCIPLITAGASTTAAYYAMAKCVRHKTGYIGREFFRSFRVNFRQVLPLTLVFYLAAAVLAIDIRYVWDHVTVLNNALFVVFAFLIFLLTGITVYLCPVLSRFQKRTLELCRTSLYLVFKYLPVTVILLLFFAGVCTAIYLMPWSVFVLPGLFLYALSFPMEYILKKLMPPAEEGSEEAEKWYYQS